MQLSAAHRHEADALLATLQPTPAWAHDSVLLSTDLLPRIFVSVEMADSAAALACRPWKAAWDATDGRRRGLRPAAVQPAQPAYEMSDSSRMVALSKDRLLVTDISDGQSHFKQLRIVDAAMQTRRSIHRDELQLPPTYVIMGTACADGALFLSGSDQGERAWLRRFS